MGYKKAVISIIAVVIVTWILISSLSSVPVVHSSSPGSGSGSGGGTGSGSGPGSGLGSGFGFSLPNFNFKLPSLNLNLGSIFKIPNFHIKWPKFNITLPPLNFNLTKANTTSSSSGGGGGHGGHGSSSSVNNKVTVLQQIILNPIFLIVVVIAIAAIMSVYAIKSMSGKKPKKKSNKKDGEGKDYKKSYDSRNEKNDVLQAVPETKTYSNSESRNYILKLKNFMGWEGKGYIKPEIPEDMPLIWDYESPLDIDIEKNMQINSSDSNLNGNMTHGKIRMNISRGKNMIKGIWDDGSEEKDIVGINIRDDAQKQLTGNLGNDILKSLKNSTLRELENSIDFQNMIKSKADADKLIRLYERIYYGQKRINSNEYYEFLRYLKNAMKDPKMFM